MALKNLFRKKKLTVQTAALEPGSSSGSSPSNLDSPAPSVVTASTSSVYSNSLSASSNITSAVYDQYSRLSSSNTSLPQELVPIVTLLNCQSNRVYAEGEVLLNVERSDQGEEADDDLFFQPAEATLRGTSLFLSSPAIKPITLDLLEATVRVQQQYTSLVLSANIRSAHHLKFARLEELQHWLAAIYLSQYERTRLSLCYTASLLSAKATQLSDLHVVMGELKYNKEEWVNIKFSKNAQWIRCYMTISPSSNKKKDGTVQFYTSTKTTKKHLICSISSIENCHAVYPSVVELIDSSALIKLQGEVVFYNLGSSTTVETSQPSSPIVENQKGKNNSHQRHTSISSLASSTSSSSKSFNNSKGYPVHKTSLYILPQQHGGVKPYETMIRVLMPLYDAFKLYGRPKRLVPDKKDQSSLLFGLPSLPKVKILTMTIAETLVVDNWDVLTSTSTSEDGFDHEADTSTTLFDTQLKTLFETDESFGGFGDLKESMAKESRFEHPFTRRLSINSQNSDFNSNSTPKYALSVSDYPLGLSSDALAQIQQRSSGLEGRMRSTSVNSLNNNNNNNRIHHQRKESRASQLRAQSYTNLNGLMEGAQIS